MGWFRLKGCPKCRGDLVLDEGDWLCVQCGTYYYMGLYGHAPPDRRPRWAPPEPRREKAQSGALLPEALWHGEAVLTKLAGPAGASPPAMAVTTAWRP